MLASTAPASEGRFTLERSSIHVWHYDLGALDFNAGDLIGILDDRERLRAARFKRTQDRTWFIAAHAALRRLLGFYLECPAHSVRLGQAAGGKPYVVRSGNDPDVRFNASRTRHRSAFVFGLGREVGIDVEEIADLPRLHELSPRALTPGECKAIDAMASEDARRNAFFALWARKEALLKARGLGLAVPLSETGVTQGSMRDGDGRFWRIADIACDPGWAAAVAAEGTDWEVGPVRAFNSSP
jgi:4'-phosphopantetheinyl transferase